MFFGLVVFAAIVASALWFVATYNDLDTGRQRVMRAWSNLDAPIRERHDELPTLLDLCRRLGVDPAAVDRVSEARAGIFGARHSFDPRALARAEREFRREIETLYAIVDADAALRAHPQLATLRRRLADLERAISERGRLYNDAVNENNVSIDQFPGRVVAGIGAFKHFEPLEL